MDEVRGLALAADEAASYRAFLGHAARLEAPLAVPCWWLHADERPAGAGGAGDGGKDASLHQLKRDVERDTFVVQGEPLRGADGAEAVLAAVVACVRDAQERLLGASPAADAGVGGSDSPLLLDDGEGGLQSALARFAASVVRAGNRTQSGGDAYDAILRVLANHDVCLVVPDSAAAQPIDISIDAGPFQPAGRSAPAGDDNDDGGGAEAPRWQWGVRATVRATTHYGICDADAVSTTWARCEATYMQQLAVPLGALHGSAAGAAVEACVCGDGGRVELRVTEIAPLATRRHDVDTESNSGSVASSEADSRDSPL